MRRFLLLTCFAAVLQGEVVDRLAIAVGREVITELQIDEELRVTAFLNHQPIARNLESRRDAADRLVEQFLIRHEMNLSRYPLPEEEEVAKYLESVRKEQGGPADFAAALRSYELTENTLKQHLALQLTTVRFVDYRFTSDMAVPDTAIEAAYQREVANWKETHHENPPALDAIRERIRQTLTAERADTALSAWLAEGRKQLSIVYLDKTLQ
ncbi:MAG TPA: hypothetical protein VK604_09435 [Bryobacteraceae bacterium]|nr:hypothetical protein [Bryobacteraceae bacterium]